MKVYQYQDSWYDEVPKSPIFLHRADAVVWVANRIIKAKKYRDKTTNEARQRLALFDSCVDELTKLNGLTIEDKDKILKIVASCHTPIKEITQEKYSICITIGNKDSDEFYLPIGKKPFDISTTRYVLQYDADSKSRWVDMGYRYSDIIELEVFESYEECKTN